MATPFEPTDAIRALMADARRAFGEDNSYAVAAARAGAVLAARRGQLPERDEVPEPVTHICPDGHPHGTPRCAVQDRCQCETCDAYREERASQKRSEALERHEARPVTIRRTEPTKRLPKGTQQPGRHVKGSRKVTSVDRTPVALPPGVLHGGHKAYQIHKCRCDSCRGWKSDSARRSRVKRAEQTALRTYAPSIDDE